MTRKGSFRTWVAAMLGLTLTVGQAAAAAVAFDGYAPRDVPGERERSVALELYGDITPTPGSRRVVVWRFGRDSGKSTLACARGVEALCFADLSGVGPGDIAAVVVIAQDRRASRTTLAKARALAKHKLARAIVRDVADGFELRRPTGEVVQFLSLVKSAQGKSSRGMSILCAILDESEFIAPSDPTKVITDKEIIAAIMPRLVSDGQLILISTPWPAESETARLFDENYKTPTSALVALGTTLVIRDHHPSIVALVDFERARDPVNAEREYDCKVRGGAGFFFDDACIDAAICDTIVRRRRQVTVGADFGFTSDASGYVPVERQEPYLVIPDARVDAPTPGEPLKPSVVAKHYVRLAKEAGSDCIVTDAHYIETVREAADEAGSIEVVAGPSVTGDTERAYTLLKTLFREGRVKLVRGTALPQQLKAVMWQPKSGGGFKIVLPRSTKLGHCDLVPALVNAAWHDNACYGPMVGPVEPLTAFTVKRAGPHAMFEGTAFRRVS
jgi:hypothetical protein